MMGLEKSILLGVAFLALSESCSLTSWTKFTMKQFLTNADMVLYGKEASRVNRTDANGDLVEQDAIFEVYCILRYNNETLGGSAASINNTITFPKVYPQHSCSGTKISVGQDVILSATIDKTKGIYTWDEVNAAPDGAAFDANQENLDAVGKMDCLGDFVSPAGGGSKACPAKTSIVTFGDSLCGASGVLVSYITMAVAILLITLMRHYQKY